MTSSMDLYLLSFHTQSFSSLFPFPYKFLIFSTITKSSASSHSPFHQKVDLASRKQKSAFMAEEFEESEVVFQEHVVEGENCDFQLINSRINDKVKRKKMKMSKKDSVPMSIPENVSRNTWLRFMESDLDGDDGEMVPPHVIVGRRVAGKMMAFSVCTGNGRTLKGRDLSQVRNSILRMTGFLET